MKTRTIKRNMIEALAFLRVGEYRLFGAFLSRVLISLLFNIIHAVGGCY
jgi:hypothetical protein